MTTLDYPDIALHLAAAILVLVNGAFWIGREAKQHRDNPWALFTRPQVFLEWFVPAICVPILLYMLAVYLGLMK